MNTRQSILVAVFIGAGCAQSAWAAGEHYALWVMKADGSEARILMPLDGYDNHFGPRWSHDGKRIAFEASARNPGRVDVLIVNVDGTGLRSLGQGSHPDWSPDDKQIALQANGPQGTEVVVQNLDGKERVEIAKGGNPRWSPDGSQLAFSQGRTLHLADLVSGEQRILMEEGYVSLYSFGWSPEGRTLAAFVRPDKGGPKELLMIDIAEPAPKARMRLKNIQSCGYVAYSPDGKRVVFDNTYLIHTVEVAGTSRPKLLTDQKGWNRDPDWSPDGKWITFVSDRK